MARGSVFKIIVNGTLWSFLGVLLTVGFFYWSESHSRYNLKISVEDEFDLIEVREEIEDLQILYKREDILTSKKQIKVLTLSIRNDGKTILQQDYDQAQVFGISFVNALILSADVVLSNSPYLLSGIREEIKSQVKSTLGSAAHSSPNILLLPKLIFDKGKFVTLKIYLLQQTIEQPLDVAVVGKIANIHEMKIHRLDKVKLLAPKLLVDILAEFKYIMVGYIAAALLVLSGAKLVEMNAKRKRARRCKEFLTKNKNLSPEQLAVIEVYKSDWTPQTQNLVKWLAEGNKIINTHELVSIELNRLRAQRPLLSRLFLFALRRLERIELPAEVFAQDRTTVMLRTDLQDFIKTFFQQVGVLKPNRGTD